MLVYEINPLINPQIYFPVCCFTSKASAGEPRFACLLSESFVSQALLTYFLCDCQSGFFFFLLNFFSKMCIKNYYLCLLKYMYVNNIKFDMYKKINK